MALGFGTAVTVIVGFLYLVYGYVFSDGLCCADDAYIAVAAKNLALGAGYAESVSPGGQGLRLFDPGLSTGPTLVLPAAAIIRVFGTTPWAPGLATALVTTALLMMIALVLGRRVGPLRTVFYLVVMLTLMYTLTAGARFVQWYSLLGEVPAAMLTILGVALLTWRSGKKRQLAWSFLALGLAVETKNLALLGVVPVAVWLLVPLIRSRGRNARQWTDLGVGAVFFSLPVLLFEAWKLSSLGINGYIANWQEFARFFSITGGTAAGGSSGPLVSLVATNSSMLHINYGFGKFQLVLVLVALGAVVHFYADHERRVFCWLLMAAGATHITWFVTSSNGNPRYALIGLLLLAAAAACVVIAQPPGVAIAAAIAAVTIAVVPTQTRVFDPVKDAQHRGMFRPTQRVVNLEATAAFLTKVHHKDPLVGGWWATVADLQYMLPTVSNFVKVEDVRPGAMQNGRLLVRNGFWAAFVPSPRFTAWEKTCHEVLLSAPPYLVTQCPQGGASDQRSIPK